MAITYFNRYTKHLEEEQVMGERWLKWIYGNPLGQCALHLLVKRAFFSKWLGSRMDKATSVESIQPFIDEYHINMDESVKQVGDFASFNDFFARKLKFESRPIHHEPECPNVAVFPADARHTGWQCASEMEGAFVKGQKFDLPALLGDDELAAQFEHGSVVLSRLCPLDYHRFHFPAEGMPGKTHAIDGYLASVSPYSLRRKLAWLWQNKRVRTQIDTEHFGRIVVLEIGATGVGGIHQTYKPHQWVYRGDEKGFFTFGGSTVMTFFLPGRIELAQDLLEQTAKGVELYAHVGDYMGKAL